MNSACEVISLVRLSAVERWRKTCVSWACWWWRTWWNHRVPRLLTPWDGLSSAASWSPVRDLFSTFFLTLPLELKEKSGFNLMALIPFDSCSVPSNYRWQPPDCSQCGQKLRDGGFRREGDIRQRHPPNRPVHANPEVQPGRRPRLHRGHRSGWFCCSTTLRHKDPRAALAVDVLRIHCLCQRYSRFFWELCPGSYIITPTCLVLLGTEPWETSRLQLKQSQVYSPS